MTDFDAAGTQRLGYERNTREWQTFPLKMSAGLLKTYRCDPNMSLMMTCQLLHVSSVNVLVLFCFQDSGDDVAPRVA